MVNYFWHFFWKFATSIAKQLHYVAMALTQGSLKILFLLQKAFPFQIQLVADPHQIKLICNPTFHNRQTLFYYIAFKLYILFLNIFSMGKKYWLVSHWKFGPDFEQLSYHVLTTAITLIGAESLHTLECYSNDWCFLITQRFKLVRHNYHGTFTNRRKFKTIMLK